MVAHSWTSSATQLRGIHRLREHDDDYDALLAAIGDRRIVLIGEASHGTHEFYRERARITRRLIEERGFGAVAVEADWPDAYRVNRYVRHRGPDATADEALADFVRFPQWMWRNHDVMRFVEWLRAHNDSTDVLQQVGFYGLDLYSLRASIDAVIAYLQRVDPEAALNARFRYACFDLVGAEGQRYGQAVRHNLAADCEDEVVEELIDLHHRRAAILQQDGFVARDEYFFAEQNARLVLNAERYYREMYRGRASSWNVRDHHMSETLISLMHHLDEGVGQSKVVVWAHNSHVGDAARTEMSRRGEFNVGQLTRERDPQQAFLIGFTTNRGRVTAASDWGGAAERKRVRPALEHSYERLLHQLEEPAFWLLTEQNEDALPPDLLERAIGVIYRPETERASHWFHADLARQFDAVIHIDTTSALEPLERTPMWEMGEPPETYPTGL